ncbi:hypothetical protein HFP72_35315 [Nocardiopsis sp. ARC36]
MAASVHAEVLRGGVVDPDRGVLLRPPPRLRPGYGPATGRLLRLVREGGDWRELAAGLFGGSVPSATGRR